MLGREPVAGNVLAAADAREEIVGDFILSDSAIPAIP